MKPIKTYWIIGLLIWLTAIQTGWSFYNPQQGRWLSRDPVEEQGGENLNGFVNNDGINRSDYLGLWATPAHEKIIDDWLMGVPNKLTCGCCTINLRQLLKNASARQDGFSGIPGLHSLPNLIPFSSHSFYEQQSADAAPGHGMSYPGEEYPVQDYEDFVNDESSRAEQYLTVSGSSCKNLKKAIADLGAAVHAVADDFSPMHTGHQRWNGLWHALTHPKAEIFDHGSGENLATLKVNPEIEQKLLADLNRRFRPILEQILRSCK